MCLLAALAAAVPSTTGCSSADGSRRNPSGSTVTLQATPYTSQIAKPTVENLAAAFSNGGGKVPRNSANALVISGGGQYASYNAGLLIGWTQAGTRPKFDVVTGISSGALVAIYAYLGSKYDASLQKFFTTVRDKDIYTMRPVRQFFNSRSLADPKPLEDLLASQVNDEMMVDLREAHQCGRRFYIGSMNVQTRRLTIWDVGAIASCDRPDAKELVRKVLLAASSIPGLMPSVHFDVQVNGVHYMEEHVDGGAVSQTFLRLAPGMERTDEPANWLKGSNLYALAAGKMYADPIDANPGLIKRVTSTVSAALYALFRAELMGLYAFCATSGMKFHLLAIPQEVQAPANSMTFQPEEMKKLFKLGFDEACKGTKWRLTPLGTEPGEEEEPRGIAPLFPFIQPCVGGQCLPGAGAAPALVPNSVIMPTPAIVTQPPMGN